MLFLCPIVQYSISYNALKQDKLPQKQQVISEMRKVFYSKRYNASINGKRAIFDKKWNTNYFDNNKGP